MNLLKKALTITVSSTLKCRFISKKTFPIFRIPRINTYRHFCLRSELISGNSENGYAYSIVKQSGIPQIHVESPTLHRLSGDTLSSEDVGQVIDELDKLSLEQLTTLIPVVGKHKNEGELFEKLWKALDVEGSKRVPFGAPDVVLAGAMKIYDANLFYRSGWVWSSLKRFCRRPDRLNVPQMLQLMFLLNIIRHIPVQYSGFDVQHYLVGFFDTLTLDQMAVVTLAFFKAETRIRNHVIMSKVMRKLLDECHDCHPITLSMICKIIRYSTPLSLADELYVLQDKLAVVVKDAPARCLTQVALSGTNVLVCHDGLLTAVTQRFLQFIPEMRLKDMERLLLVLSLFNLRELADSVVSKILEELPNRDKEIEKFPKALLCLVNYLCLLNHYDYSLIDRVLSPKFIKDTYGFSIKRIGGELIYIDRSVAVERADYNGNALGSSQLKSCAKVMTYRALDSSPGASGTQRFSYELEAVLSQLYGIENLKFISLLPQYFMSDLVLGLDSDMKPVPPGAEWSVHKWGEIKYPPDQNNVWIAFVIGGWNMFIRNKNEPLGSMCAKLRQLRILGYHPIIVKYNEWRNSTDKINYLKSIIDPELRNIFAKRAKSAQ